MKMKMKKNYKQLISILLVLLMMPMIMNTTAYAYLEPEAIYMMPTVKKSLIGTVPVGFSETFTVKIEGVSTNAAGVNVNSMPMPDYTTVSTKPFTEAGDKDFGSFGGIRFTEPGTYVYKITETAGSTENLIYDKSEYTLTVNVTDKDGWFEAAGSFSQTKNSDGMSIDPPGAPKTISFTNKFASAYTVPPVKKTLTGTIPSGFSTVFNAKIERVSTNASGVNVDTMPMPASSTVSTEAFTASGEKDFAQFGKILFTQPGNYIYKITENVGSTTGMTYDMSEYQLTVQVYEGQFGLEAHGYIKQTKDSEGEDIVLSAMAVSDVISFTNTYKKSSSNNNNYTLTFNSNGGSIINSITRPSGSEINLAQYIPVREGYTFNGWYSDKSITEKITSIVLTKDTTIYAGWTFNGALNADDHVAYVLGYPDGNVGPERNITRAETSMMLYRLLTKERSAEITVSTSNFPDVDINEWYGVASCSMANGKYIVGYQNGTFGGDRKITRAEFVTMLVRFIGEAEGTKSFSDVPSSHWAYNYISTATAAGWIDGYSNGTFGPENLITRTEVMTIVNRVLNRGVDEDSELLSYKEWPDNQKNMWYYYDVIEATNAHEYTGSRPSENWTKLL